MSDAWNIENAKSEEDISTWACGVRILGGKGRFGNVNYYRDFTKVSGNFAGIPTHKKIKVSY